MAASNEQYYDDEAEHPVYNIARNQIHTPQGLRNTDVLEDRLLNQLYGGAASSSTTAPQYGGGGAVGPRSSSSSSTTRTVNASSAAALTSATPPPRPPTGESRPPSHPASRSASRSSRTAVAAASAAAAAAVASISPSPRSPSRTAAGGVEMQQAQHYFAQNGNGDGYAHDSGAAIRSGGSRGDAGSTRSGSGLGSDDQAYEDVGGSVLALNAGGGAGQQLVEVKRLRGADGKMKIAIGETDQVALATRQREARTPRRHAQYDDDVDDGSGGGLAADEPDYAHLVQDLEARERAAAVQHERHQAELQQQLALIDERARQVGEREARVQKAERQVAHQQQRLSEEAAALNASGSGSNGDGALSSDELRELRELRAQRAQWQLEARAFKDAQLALTQRNAKCEQLARENTRLQGELKQVNHQVDQAIRNAQQQLQSPRAPAGSGNPMHLQLPQVKARLDMSSPRGGSNMSSARSPRFPGASPRAMQSPRQHSIAGLHGDKGLVTPRLSIDGGGGIGGSEGAVYTREDLAAKQTEIATLERHLAWAQRELQMLREKVAANPVHRIVELENAVTDRDRTIKQLEKDLRMLNRVVHEFNKKVQHDEATVGVAVTRIENELKHSKERCKLAEQRVAEQERVIWNQNRLIGEFQIDKIKLAPDSPPS